MALLVGVLTMHRVRNCGSFLQAYATQYMINKIGCSCEIIDYIYPNSYHGYSDNTTFHTRKTIIRKLIKSLLHYRKQEFYDLIEIESFCRYFRKLKLSKCSYDTPDKLIDSPPQYDVYLVGSDQVWNERFIKQDSVFFCCFVRKGKCISYASSMPEMNLSKDFVHLCKEQLQKFSYISTREEKSATFLRTLLKKNVYEVLDPVFLVSPEEWMRIFKCKRKARKKYVFVYFLNYMSELSDELSLKLELIRKKYEYEIIYYKKPKNLIGKDLKYITIKSFLELILNSSLVLTDSFHAAAFSILFNTPIITLHNDSDSRIPNLINKVTDKFDDVYYTNKLKLEKEILKSYDFFKNSLIVQNKQK